MARFLSPLFFPPSTSTRIRKGHSEQQLKIITASLIKSLTKYTNTLGSNVLTRLITHTKKYSIYLLIEPRGRSPPPLNDCGKNHPSSKDKVHTTYLFLVQSLLIICVWLMTSAYSHRPIKLDQLVCILVCLMGSVHACPPFFEQT